MEACLPTARVYAGWSVTEQQLTRPSLILKSWSNVLRQDVPSMRLLDVGGPRFVGVSGRERGALADETPDSLSRTVVSCVKGWYWIPKLSTLGSLKSHVKFSSCRSCSGVFLCPLSRGDDQRRGDQGIGCMKPPKPAAALRPAWRVVGRDRILTMQVFEA